MPKLVSISDELHQTLKDNEDSIKADYLTIKNFADAAIRAALRRRHVKVGDDEIVAHLVRLKESKARHINQQAVIHKKAAHKRRIQRQKKKLEKMVTEE